MIREHKPISKLVVIGDIHFGVHSNSYEWLTNIAEFFHKLLIPFLYYLRDKKKYNDVQVLFLGDINDIKQMIHTLVQNQQIAIFEEMAKIYPVMVIIGNHDTPFKNKKKLGDLEKSVNSCRSISLIDNINIYEDATVLDCINGERILLMPFTDDKERELEIIKENEAEYLFCHSSIAGFTYDGYPVEESKHISLDDVKVFKKVYAGHIHKRQSKENVLYVGAPYHTKNEEHENDTGFTIIDFEKGKEHWIENEMSPKFKHINLFHFMNMKLSEANKFVSNSYVTLISPMEIAYRLNINNIYEVVSGHRTIEVSTVSERSKADIGQMIGDQDIDESQNINIGKKLMDYVDQLTNVKIDKKFIDVSDPLRKALTENVNKLYKAASHNIDEMEEVETE